MASPKANTAEDERDRSDDSDGPLVDQVIAAVKKMIAKGKERGYVTYDDINTALPQGQVSSEQIEDTMSMLSELGINVVENEEGEEAAACGARLDLAVFHVRVGRFGAAEGGVEIDDVAQQEAAFDQGLAPLDDGAQGQWAFADAADHLFAARLDTLGDGDFALSRE